MQLAESCVIEQHIDKLLKVVEPIELGVWHARDSGRACDVAAAPKSVIGW